MKTKIILAVVLLLGVAVSKADAQIVRKQATERVRIAQGVKSGELTRPEAHRLRKGQRHVRRDIHRARKDGKVTPRERKHIKHEQRKQSRRTYHAKHNRRKRAAK